MQHVNCNFAKLERVLSKERLCGYKPNDVSQLTQETISLYRWNIVLSELLYPLLHVIEVAFRNSLFNAVAEYVKDPNWLVDSNFLAEGEVQEIKKQVKYLQYKNQLDISHLIAELKFGFWVRLLDRRYEYKQLLWPTLLRTTFPYLDNRKIHLIRKIFNKIRILRNRVYHYEPIWQWHDLLQQHEQIIKAISWMEPELLKLVDIERFIEIYNLGIKCYH